ncbi:hypothetical protein OXYTRIMIC_174 [Oxytricha trifallax]|uniref:Uncharacterized protein n=1 Tax=Oxytricha trifallax TaxID=1172189 RepID=A0A073ICC5_9SPIT|nr:hypothetical protein OXYTRIMIC_174 [Oxytricha trifallax]
MSVSEQFSQYNTQILNATQKIAEQQKQIHDQNTTIEQLLKPQICMFSFDGMQKEYKELESQIGKLQELIGNKTIQTEIEKLKEMFKTQNDQGFLKISNEIEKLLQSNIYETKKNVEKIQEMRSLIYQNSGDLISNNVVSKVKMEQFIDEEIQNQNLDKKIELHQDLQKFMERFGIEPQSEQEGNETQQ